MVRREYEEVRWYAVPIADSPFQPIVGEEVVPIFTVRHAGQEYDFRNMGLGELSAHLLLWILAYTEQGSAGPLLLDEPEAFMPAPSREVVLSYLLEEAFKRSAPIVVASHSLELIQPALDSGSAVYLSETANRVTAIGPSEALSELVAGLFGRSAPADWLVLCEDESAYILADQLMKAASPRLWQACRFLWCKGYGDLETIWNHLPRPVRFPEGVMSFAFIADGDKAAAVARAKEVRSKRRATDDSPWPLFCLPGDPDALMKMAAEPDAEVLAGQFRITVPALRGTLARLRGREAHNWIEDILSIPGVDRQAGLKALAQSYVKLAGTNGGLDQFRAELLDAGMLVEYEESDG